MHHNLLSDPIIRVALRSGEETGASLPDVLACLARDEIARFPELAPWQGHPWHAFLVQVGGLALNRSGASEPPRAVEDWAALLRGLARAEGWTGGDEPWCLVVEDWTQPAFLQPPLPAATHDELKSAVERPDLLDILVTAKNHDIKAGRADRATPGQWLFALLSLQTTEGYSGAGLFGIARMNGGFSSRPAIGLAPGHTPGAHFRRDLAVLLAGRDDLLWQRGPRGAAPAPWGFADGGLGLVWLRPWDGKQSLALSELDPWFIEICRRVRLQFDKALGIVARTAGSKAPRIDAKQWTGNVGDPWVPVSKEGKALTVGGGGFHYAALSEILWGGGFVPPPMQRWHKGIDRTPVSILARVLVRGQGQTEGYHERVVPVPDQGAGWLLSDDARERLGEIARRRIQNDIPQLRNRVLYPALRRLLRPREDDEGRLPPGESGWINKHLATLDDAIDRRFFDLIWPEAMAEDEAAEEAAQREWRGFLVAEARLVFERALEAAPTASSRTYRAIAGAEGTFEALLHRHFDDVLPQRHEEPAHE